MKKYSAIIRDISNLTPSILRVRLEPTGQAVTFPSFLPGQYATVSFPSERRLKGERPFSIASSAASTRRLEFGVRTGGNWTAGLRALRPGMPATVSGPFGEFIFDHEFHHSVVMIAGGIGITPFMSMIRTATDMGWNNELTLIYSVRSLREAAYLPELQRLQEKNPGLNVVTVVSDGNIPTGSPYVGGRISPGLISQVLGKDVAGRAFFVCGPEGFMNMIMKQLESLGVYRKTIRSERFAVSSKSLIEPGSPMPKIIFAGWGLAAAMFMAVVVHGELERREIANASENIAPLITMPTTTYVPTNSTNLDSTSSSNSSTAPSTNTSTATTQPSTTPTYTPPPQQQQVPMYYVPRTRAS